MTVLPTIECPNKKPNGTCAVITRLINAPGIEYFPSRLECNKCASMKRRAKKENCMNITIAYIQAETTTHTLTEELAHKYFISCNDEPDGEHMQVEYDLIGKNDGDWLAAHSAQPSQGVGTELRKLIHWFASDKGGCKCKDHELTMNRMGPKGCAENIDRIVGWLLAEAKRRNWPTGKIAEAGARTLVKRAIRNATRNSKPLQIPNDRYYVAITTAPRKDPTLIQCVESFRHAGFEPHIYAEPESVKTNCETFWNDTRKGVWFNWLHSARHALDNSDASFIITAQDDVLIHPQTRTTLDEIVSHDSLRDHLNGFLSLYTPRHYARRKYAGAGIKRVYTKSFWGACCIVWPRTTLRAVIDHPIAAKWNGARPRTKATREAVYQKRRDNPHLVQNSDTAIGRIMNALELPMNFIVPSPAMHIARHSAASHGSNTGNRNCSPCADHGKSLNAQIAGTIPLPPQ